MQKLCLTYIHTYHSRFIPEGVAEVSQIFLRDTHVLPKLVSYEEHCRRNFEIETMSYYVINYVLRLKVVSFGLVSHVYLWFERS
jgi:hypothetical protein